jgi:cytochrome c oxidase assembly factor CtaG
MGSTDLTSALVATMLVAFLCGCYLATSKFNSKFGVSTACPITFTEAAGTLVYATAAVLGVLAGPNVLANMAFPFQSSNAAM